MVYRGYDVKFEFPVGRRLENARVDFYFFDTGAVEFFEGGNDACLLPCPRRSVYEEVGKVSALRLEGVSF
jgi:hypothetical protein